MHYSNLPVPISPMSDEKKGNRSCVQFRFTSSSMAAMLNVHDTPNVNDNWTRSQIYHLSQREEPVQ